MRYHFTYTMMAEMKMSESKQWPECGDMETGRPCFCRNVNRHNHFGNIL